MVKGKETLIFIRWKDKGKKECNSWSNSDPLIFVLSQDEARNLLVCDLHISLVNETCKMMCPGENGSSHLVHTVQ